MVKTAWVIVADRGGARIFSAPSPTGVLAEIESFVHPEGRLPGRELKSDQPGRAFDSGGRGRHAMETEVDPRKHAAMGFARQLATRLASARTRNEADRFVLVAAPEFLGLLRDALDKPTRRAVAGEFALDLVKMTAAEIRSRLPERLYSNNGG